MLASNNGILIFAPSSISLLPFEKWILGWLPDASVYCRDSKIDLYKEEKNISLNFQYSIGDQSYLIPISSRSLLVIDFIKYKDIYNLVSYQLDIDNRPAIKSFQIYNKPQQKSLDLSNFGGIADQFISDNFTILVTNNNEKMVSVNVISEVSTNIEQKKLLVSSAEANRQEAEKILKESGNKIDEVSKQNGDMKKPDDKPAGQQTNEQYNNVDKSSNSKPATPVDDRPAHQRK